ncbi:hypothetical protein B0T12DRAFT_426604 [Alternaria alternata]|nr:hypothetical protein B0T12DRAFT_426604 [Alternaria alternata]
MHQQHSLATRINRHVYSFREESVMRAYTHHHPWGTSIAKHPPDKHRHKTSIHQRSDHDQ